MLITDTKPLLRAEMKTRRSAMAAGNIRAGDQLADATAAALDVRDLWPAAHTIIAGYWPIQSEINPFPLMQVFEDRGYRLVLPCLKSDGAGGYTMIFRRYRIGDPMISGPFDIREPAGDAPEILPDMVLLPLLGFDARGRRLGYGGGYYDRSLEHLRSLRDITAYGVAFSAQQLDEIPFEAHDQPLNAILTERGLVEAAAS